MKTIAVIYLVLMVYNKIAEVFLFGTERKPYSPAMWVAGLIINLPIYWLLWHIITN